MDYYLCKVTIDSLEERARPIKSQILVEAETVTDAETIVAKHIGEDIASHTVYEVTAVTKTKIESVIKQND